MLAKFRSLLMVICISGLSLAACQTNAQIGVQADMHGNPYRIISVEELQSMLEDKNFATINIHTPWQGDIHQTDLRIAYDQIEQNADQLLVKNDAKIVIYRLTSGMAKKAIATLLGQDYTNVWMLEGGATAWEEAADSYKGMNDSFERK